MVNRSRRMASLDSLFKTSRRGPIERLDRSASSLYMERPDLDTIDDPFRKCEICDIRYLEDYGHTCKECDIWICNNCWPEHIGDPRHP
jgi:hypothetical protein